MTDAGPLTSLNENSAPALTAAGAGYEQTHIQRVRGACLTTFSASLIGPRAPIQPMQIARRRGGRAAIAVRKPAADPRALTGGVSRAYIVEQVAAILEEGASLSEAAMQASLADTICLAFEVADVLEGRGERTLFVWLFLALAHHSPAAMLNLLRQVPHYASWKALAMLYEQVDADLAAKDCDNRVVLEQIRAAIPSLWARQLVLDDWKLQRYEVALAKHKALPAALEEVELAVVPESDSKRVEREGAAAVLTAAVALVDAQPPVARAREPRPPQLSLAAKWAPRVGAAFDTRCAIAQHIVFELDRLRAAGGAAAILKPRVGPCDTPMEVDEDEGISVTSLLSQLDAAARAPGATGEKREGGRGVALPVVADRGKRAAGAVAAKSKEQNGAEMQYRKLLSKVCAQLDVVEQKLCSQRWAEIEPTHVPSKANKLYKAAFMNGAPKHIHPRDAEKDAGCRAGLDVPTVGRRSADPDRVACAEHFLKAIAGTRAGATAKRIKGARNQVHELVKLYLETRGPPVEDPLLEAMWADLVRGIKEKATFKPGVPLVDVSDSMAGLPMQVSIALGILMSTLQPVESPWYGKMITFETRPKWHDISKCKSLAEMVRSVRAMSWGGSTNFGAAMQMLVDHARTNRLTPAEIPAQLFVFTDMQFDLAGGLGAGRNFPNAYGIRDSAQAGPDPEDVRPFLYAGKDVRAAFRDEGYPVPQLVLWNLRSGDKPNFQAETSTPGVSLMAGFSQECLRQFCESATFITTPESASASASAAGSGSGEDAVAVEAVTATPWDVLYTKLASERYDRIRTELELTGEGVLRGYKWCPPPRAETPTKGEGAGAGSKRKRK